MRFVSVIGHPLLISWEYDGWCLGTSLMFILSNICILWVGWSLRNPRVFKVPKLLVSFGKIPTLGIRSLTLSVRGWAYRGVQSPFHETLLVFRFHETILSFGDWIPRAISSNFRLHKSCHLKSTSELVPRIGGLQWINLRPTSPGWKYRKQYAST